MPKFTKHLKKNRINRTIKRNRLDSRQKNNKLGGGLNDIANAARAARLGYNASRVGTELSNIKNVSNFADLKTQFKNSGIQNNVNNIGKQLGIDPTDYYNKNFKNQVNNLTNKFKDSGIQGNLNQLKSKATDYYNTNFKDKVNDLRDKYLSNTNSNNKNQSSDNNEREGVLDMIGNTISGTASYIGKNIADNSLEILGLERIDKSKENQNQNKVPGVLSKVKDVSNKASIAVIDNINKFLESETVSKSVKDAGKVTANITKKLADKFNAAMDDPEIKAKVKEAIVNAGEIGEVIAEASEEPIKKFAKVSGKAATTAFGAASSGAIKVGTDILAALPGVGAIFDIGKMFNDSTKAFGTIVKASTEVIETASDAFTDTSEEVKKRLKELEGKKEMSQEISNRTDESIKEFENPQQVQQGGYNKTKRRFNKHTSKSRKVKFAI